MIKSELIQRIVGVAGEHAFGGAMAAGMKRPVLTAGCHPHELLCAIA